MKTKVNLHPIIGPNLDILFVGLNPAKTSNEKGHYFSTDPSLWEQLYGAGLIKERVDMDNADEKVFKSSEINCNGWKYGITDLVPDVVKSCSRFVEPTEEDNNNLKQMIIEYSPKVAVLLHSKVRERFVKEYLGKENVKGHGCFGKLIDGCCTIFYSVPFPHNNEKLYSAEMKIELYKEIKEFLLENSNC